MEHTLQVAIQATLDVASHVVSDERLGEPETNRDLFAAGVGGLDRRPAVAGAPADGGVPQRPRARLRRRPRGDRVPAEENEWYKAAYYDGLSATYFDYPAGTNTATVCAAPTATANRANCANAAGGVTDVGAYTGSASPYGTFDQGGNVWEWNEQIVSGSHRGLRGGAWSSGASSLAASGRETGTGGGSGDIGFRVASLVPEPGTGLLLMTGLAGLAARQERRKRNL